VVQPDAYEYSARPVVYATYPAPQGPGQPQPQPQPQMQPPPGGVQQAYPASGQSSPVATGYAVVPVAQAQQQGQGVSVVPLRGGEGMLAKRVTNGPDDDLWQQQAPVVLGQQPRSASPNQYVRMQD
jgi:hypothetical protein